MRELHIHVRRMTDEVMKTLEERGMIRRFRPSRQALSAPQGEIGVEYLYATDARYGPHTVICVGFNRSVVDMAYHSDCEDFILINEGRSQKPLILIIALHSAQDFLKLVSTGRLTTEDVWAVELVFNDPNLSFFTMNARTPHCEWTIPGGEPASVFYVEEPHDLDSNHLNMGDYQLNISI
jgi:hypothetical protein